MNYEMRLDPDAKHYLFSSSYYYQLFDADMNLLKAYDPDWMTYEQAYILATKSAKEIFYESTSDCFFEAFRPCIVWNDK